MRQKVAKALRREAREFAAQTGRTVNRYKEVWHERYFMRPELILPDLDPKTGKFRTIPPAKIRDDRLQVVLVDGPRFFLKALKHAWKRDLLASVA